MPPVRCVADPSCHCNAHPARRGVPVWIALLLLAGCASGPGETGRDTPADAACAEFFAELDRRVEGEGVRDGVGAPPSRWPYLRGSRFLDGMGDALDDPEVRRAWFDRAVERDRTARTLEIANLDPGVRAELSLPEGAADPAEAAVACGDRLRRADRVDHDDGPWAAVAEALTVPDDYITWQRAAGLYPVSRWFIGAGVARWQAGVRDAFGPGAAADADGPVYHPGGAADPDGLLAEAPRDALGWPELEPAEWQTLLRAHAPVVHMGADAPYNRMGRPGLDAAGLPVVDQAEPMVYTLATPMRIDGETLVQLNYVWWFSERPRDHWFDLLGGRLDGLTLRLTLDADGEVLLAETMHNCGCYHQHYPVAGLTPRSAPDYAERPLILPGPGPRVAGERLHLWLEDATHYVEHLAWGAAQPVGRRYAFADYDRLRSLPAGGGDGRRSLFRADGLVAGTERGERWFLWVSGVPEPGAMRQYHRHPTAFVGRRHFDDPDLLERIYVREAE